MIHDHSSSLDSREYLVVSVTVDVNNVSVSSSDTPLVSGSQVASVMPHTAVSTPYTRNVVDLPRLETRLRNDADTIMLVAQLVAVARLTALALHQDGCISLLTTQGRVPSPGAKPAR